MYKNPHPIYENMSLVYDQCTIKDYSEGMSWYESANSFSLDLSKKYKVSEMKVSAIIAALSPQKSWKHNKELSEEFLQSEGTSCRHTTTQKNKAYTIYSMSNVEKTAVEKVLGGMKTVNFFNNIHNPKDRDFVTIDRHHLYVCLAEDVERCTNKQYKLISDVTKKFAKDVNLQPNHLQAVLWVTWKRIKKEMYGTKKNDKSV